MRKMQTLIISDQGRDRGKTFVIREMDAFDAENWAWGALEAIGQKFHIPSGILEAGWAGVAAMGLQALLGAPHNLTKPLLDEMIASCVAHVPDPKNQAAYRGAQLPGNVAPLGPLLPEDIEEVRTILFLRDKVFELHSGFSVAASLSLIWEEGKAAVGALTQTSDQPSAPSSPAGGRA